MTASIALVVIIGTSIVNIFVAAFSPELNLPVFLLV